MSQPHSAQHSGTGWWPGCHGGGGTDTQWPSVGSTLSTTQHHDRGTGVSALPRHRGSGLGSKGEPCRCREFSVAPDLDEAPVTCGSTSARMCPTFPTAGTKREAKALCHHDSRGSGPPAQSCSRARCPSVARVAAYPSPRTDRDVLAREPWEPECKYFIVNRGGAGGRRKKCYYRNRFTRKRLKKKGGLKKKAE